MLAQVIVIIFEFFTFAFIGFIIDTSFSIYEKKKLVVGNYFQPLPLCPIYGFGGLMLIFYFKTLVLPIFLLLPLVIVSLVGLELAGGIFSKRVLNVTLWDYSDKLFNYQGHIDLAHTFYWSVLAVVFYYWIFPLVLILEERIINLFS